QEARCRKSEDSWQTPFGAKKLEVNPLNSSIEETPHTLTGQIRCRRGKWLGCAAAASRWLSRGQGACKLCGARPPACGTRTLLRRERWGKGCRCPVSRDVCLTGRRCPLVYGLLPTIATVALEPGRLIPDGGIMILPEDLECVRFLRDLPSSYLREVAR